MPHFWSNEVGDRTGGIQIEGEIEGYYPDDLKILIVDH
jgi:hypothetical protein